MAYEIVLNDARLNAFAINLSGNNITGKFNNKLGNRTKLNIHIHAIAR